MTNKTLELGRDMNYLIENIEKNLARISFFDKTVAIKSIIVIYPPLPNQGSGQSEIHLQNHKEFKCQKNLPLSRDLKQATDVYMLLLREAHNNALNLLKKDYESLSDTTCDQLKEKYFPDESSK